MRKNNLPGDPIKWVENLEKIWQEKNGDKASLGYTDDAVFIFGCEQKQDKKNLIRRPKEWFEYAKDLKINKKYIAHTENCIVVSWKSIYTDPSTKKIVNERGIEYFKFRDGKIFEQHSWQHSWNEGEKPLENGITTH